MAQIGAVKLRYDKRAIVDIEAIYEHIAAKDPGAATRVVARIKTLAEQLVDRPELGRATSLPRIRLRSVVNHPYVIFYTSTSDAIVVLHVRHTARREPAPDELT